MKDDENTELTISVRTTKTSCPYCGVGCGVQAKVDKQGSILITGDEKHPANFGKLCSKGLDLGNVLSKDNRLLQPIVNQSGSDWDTALTVVSERLKSTIDKHGPESVAFYVSGQLLTEDYYVVNKFVKGFLGTANIDTNSRLCMASSVAGHKRAFGSDTVPGCYEDLELADLVILTGSNLAWCHPVLFQRLYNAQEKSPDKKLIVIDPRRTATAELADTHLQIKPGTDSILFSGLLNFLANNNALNHRYIKNNVSNLEEALAACKSFSPDRVARVTGLSERTVKTFYQQFLDTEKTVTVYSQGINQSENGTDSVNTIINCHLASGRIGLPGMGPFSITGQPNAMGGREVGGLSNMLAAHMDLDNESHRQLVQDFWRSPAIAEKPGLKAVNLFDAVSNGEIRFIWIMATNPVDSLPVANQVRNALKKCPFVVVSDIVDAGDTTEMADVLLPSAAWGEKDGTVTNSERCISRQRSFKDFSGQSRPDWWQVTQVAHRLGYEKEFPYTNPVDIFREHAALSAYQNQGQRDFNIGAYSNISQAEYDGLTPFQWPAPADTGSTYPHRFFGQGNFYTADGCGKFVSVEARVLTRNTKLYPLTLNTGRIRDQWHTMTRTGYSVKLNTHLAEPFIELNPDDARRIGIGDAELVQISSANGCVVVRALITQKQQPGSVFVPIHWSDQFASNARVDVLVSAVTDPVSGQPASKSEPVNIMPVNPASYGFALVREKDLLSNESLYWARVPCDNGWRQEFASARSMDEEALYWKSILESNSGSYVEAADKTAGIYRMAVFEHDRLEALIYLGVTPVNVSRVWASRLLKKDIYTLPDRTSVLAGVASSSQPDVGAIVCSCFMVGYNEIYRAVNELGCRTINEVGDCVKAGTNCGSCRSEIKSLLSASLSGESKKVAVS